MSKGHKLAGGIGSRVVVRKPVRVGVGARAVNKNWPAQVGGSKGNSVQGGLEGGAGGRVLRNVRAEPYAGRSSDPVPLGNSLVNNVGKGGPGSGRQVYKSGSQRGLQSPKSRPSGTFD